MESGFNYQSFEGECGTFTLIHTLLLFGIPVTVDEALEALNQSKTKTRMFGTEAKKIVHALQKYGCQALVYDIDGDDKAKRKIDEALENHYPVILSVEGGEHWAVLGGKRSPNEYIYINSAEGELFGNYTWKEVSQWLKYEADKDSESCFYFIVVRKNNLEHAITGKAAELLKMYDNDEILFNWWGYYLIDLIKVLDSPQDKKDSVSAKDFFHKYRDMILQAATESYLYSEDECLEYELCNYEKVARMHSLAVSKDREIEAALKMTAIMTLLAVGIE